MSRAALGVAAILLALGTVAAGVALDAGTVTLVVGPVAVVLLLAGLRYRRRAYVGPIDAMRHSTREGLEPANHPSLRLTQLRRAFAAYQTHLTETLASARAAREAAEEADRYETEFLKSVSHELRTPLNAIIGFSQVLLDEIDGPLTESQRQDVETILSSGEHLGELVDEVLDLAAIQSGRFRLEKQQLDVRPLVTEVGRLMRGQRRKRPVDIKTELPDEPLHIDADPTRVRQILTNLASNAMKFTDAGYIKLSAQAHGEMVRLSVEDTGAGIGRDEIRLIFQEFTQVGDVRRKSQGSGLGLAICKRLTELHGGRIDVESVVQQGSTFHVDLPRWHP
ncbi:MAG: HAMP domain-containing sensor histidine kinase [Myxococcota bacterium]